MDEPSTPKAQPWYAEGLCFECTRCGNCCTGASGTVRVSEEEACEIADSLDLEPAQFHEIYTRRLEDGALSLRERSGGACIFFRPAAGCEIYSHRPRQCRTWPFWRSVVAKPERWAEESRECPGMNHGEQHAADEIRVIAEADGTSGKIR
jgi:Fe-S-cluster containining protein